MKLQKQENKNRVSNNLSTIFILGVLFTFNVFGQKKAIDSANFIFYPDKIMIRTNLNTQTDEYRSNDKKGDNLYLMTNNNYKLFFSFDYKFIGFSYGFYPGFIGGNKDEDLKGKSTFSDYNFRFFLGRWLQTANYSKTRGYYIENTNDFDQNWQEGIDPYLQLPNFKTITYGMSTSYIFNPKFSLKSITSFTEWQKESAGSFVPTLVYDYNRISYELSVADELQQEYDIRLGTGYFYNFIIHKHFYIAPNLTPSIGVKFSNSTGTQIDPNGNVTTKENDTYFTTNIDGGLKMGYNSDRVLFGMSLVFNVNSYNETKTAIVSENRAYGLLYFGYRFNAPNFISKPVKVIEDKLKL